LGIVLLAASDDPGSAATAAPRVSVLMPVHNGVPYLLGAIDSVLAQTFEDFELVVINDASTDSTVEVLARYAAQNNRIRVLHNPENRGVAGTLNVGLAAARGEFIAIMHADDLSLRHRLERQVQFLDDHPDHVLVGTHFDVIDAAGSVRRTATDPTEYWQLDWLAHFRTPVGHPTAMFRAWLPREKGLLYNTKYRAAEDTDMWMRVLQYGKSANLPVPLVQYRMHAENITSRLTDTANNEACEIAFAHLIGRYPDLAEQEKPLRLLYHYLFFRELADGWRASDAANTMQLIEARFLGSRELSLQQKRQIDRIAAQLLAIAAVRAGSVRDLAELFYAAPSYRRHFITEAFGFFASHATNIGRRGWTGLKGLRSPQSPRTASVS
jgi:glycosyltransferase involved in cell wall biosynthesis